MLCVDFENLLTDYIEGVVGPETNRLMGEHAMKCPVCHETLLAVRSTIETCRTASVPAPSRELEARILQKTVPDTAMGCEEFEECLTDYLDGFLPAHLYHRWERHAAMCDRCTELPGEVVRSIGACSTYISEERPLPLGLNERILQATLGTTTAQEIKAPWTARAASRSIGSPCFQRGVRAAWLVRVPGAQGERPARDEDAAVHRRCRERAVTLPWRAGPRRDRR